MGEEAASPKSDGSTFAVPFIDIDYSMWAWRVIQKDSALPPRFGRFVTYSDQDETHEPDAPLTADEVEQYWYSEMEMKTMRNVYTVECKYETEKGVVPDETDMRFCELCHSGIHPAHHSGTKCQDCFKSEISTINLTKRNNQIKKNRLLGIKDPYMVSEEAKKLEAEKAKLSHWQRRMQAVKDVAAQQGEAVKEIRASMMGLGKSKANKDDADNRDQGITDLNVEKAFMRGDVEAAWAQNHGSVRARMEKHRESSAEVWNVSESASVNRGRHARMSFLGDARKATGDEGFDLPGESLAASGPPPSFGGDFLDYFDEPEEVKEKEATTSATPKKSGFVRRASFLSGGGKKAATTDKDDSKHGKDDSKHGKTFDGAKGKSYSKERQTFEQSKSASRSRANGRQPRTFDAANGR